MKKRTIAIVISVALALIIAVSSTCIWAANNPNFTVSIGKPIGETDIYIEICMTGYGRTLGIIPPSNKRMTEYMEMGAILNAACREFRDEYKAPTHLELDFTEAEDGGTIATYHGTVTKDGVTSEFNKQWKFDFKYVAPQK